MRVAYIAAGALLLAGCMLGFDEHKLRGGDPSDPAAIDGGSGVATPTPDGSGLPVAPVVPPACDNFASYASGAAIPNWVDGQGTWRVMMVDAQTHGLGQTAASTSHNELFVGWYDTPDWTDETVQATVTPTDSGPDNCVLARVTSASSFYKLCIRTDHGRQQQMPQTSWDLQRVDGGSQTQLAGANGGATSGPHTLILGAHGSTLAITVDGVAQPNVTDAMLPKGAVGLATESSGPFVLLCAAAM
jgi:hypothetical protein